MSQQSPNESGTLPEIPGYRVQRRLGVGGMAEVFLAEQVSLDRQVAIKVLAAVPGQSLDLSVRFEREARTIARLEHPDIVGIYDVGRTSEGRLYYAMPYLANGDLSQRDVRGRPQQLLGILKRVCHALEYAHNNGIVHRDVKPENILFDGSDNARLADFGIAISTDHDHRVTAEGRTLGSSGYMSPEQARGVKLDGRADLYALGVVLFEMLTGSVPYQGSDSLSVALKHTQDPIPKLGASLGNWQPVIDRALAKQPAQRFQTAREMLLAIEDAAQADGAVDTRDMQVLPPPKNERMRWQRVAIAASAMLLIGAGALAWTLWPSSAENSRPDFFEADSKAEPAVAASSAAEPAPDETLTLVVTADAPLDDAIRAQLLTEALGLIQQDHLFEPKERNAAARIRTLYADKEGDAGVDAAVTALLTAASDRIDAAAIDANWKVAASLWKDSGAFAKDVDARGGAIWKSLDAKIANDLRARLEAALASEEKAAVRTYADAIAVLSGAHPDLRALSDRIAALPEPGEAVRDTGGPELVYVPASIGASRIERGFAMMRHEVTRGEYEAFANATSRRPAQCKGDAGLRSLLTRADWRKPGFPQDSRHPAVCISYNDSVAFANWLSARLQARYRLPTSAEWRHAASTLDDSAACTAGNVLDSGSSRSRGAYACKDGTKNTAPVGGFGATPLGLFDLGGNAGEWTSDCASGSGGQCAQRVASGRSWRTGASGEDAKVRAAQGGDAGVPWVGFRLVREVGVR